MVPGFCKEKQTLSEQHTDSLVDILYPFQVHSCCIFAWQRFARPKIITTHITKALSISHRIHGMNRIFTYECIYIIYIYAININLSWIGQYTGLVPHYMGKLHNECRDGNAYDSFHLGQLYIFSLSVVGLEAQWFFVPSMKMFLVRERNMGFE